MQPPCIHSRGERCWCCQRGGRAGPFPCRRISRADPLRVADADCGDRRRQPPGALPAPERSRPWRTPSVPPGKSTGSGECKIKGERSRASICNSHQPATVGMAPGLTEPERSIEAQRPLAVGDEENRARVPALASLGHLLVTPGQGNYQNAWDGARIRNQVQLAQEMRAISPRCFKPSSARMPAHGRTVVVESAVAAAALCTGGLRLSATASSVDNGSPLRSWQRRRYRYRRSGRLSGTLWPERDV